MSRTSIPHFTEPHLRNFDTLARSLDATAPIGHTIDTANWVSPKALNRARCWPSRSDAQVLSFSGGVGRQHDHRRYGFFSGEYQLENGEEEEEEDGDRNNAWGYGDSVHDWKCELLILKARFQNWRMQCAKLLEMGLTVI
ncbi:unnamed protein product [Lupinus luteus]|uniref:Uncharacterized protein n=1 Tax=Lupinus luteus TaxID=3873 RepID=A0AAV1XF86_LUPLU